MLIRPEIFADYDAIRQILIDAFADHPFSHQTEHLIVEALREANAMTIGLVAVEESPSNPCACGCCGQSQSLRAGTVVGHIAFSEAKIDGKECGWFMLGPIAVDPKRQRQGIGQALVWAGLQELRKRGAQGCILVGDPAFYNRFGFKNLPSLTMQGVPPEVILSLPLTDNIPEGEVTYHTAFTVGL
jgi:putative acetyltransferase